ncbi:decaprenyl-phosphate phosphoribosyltransferase [Segatella hominis]|uniref:decaprenyl-phosphate phosphoribosyltransferase n=1 Tax=Segatella hominis TaxID=2518605 RepID=UPI0021C9444F|nr:decaprenyl-phosphate phosphoribosyltransferase [Segatella hominis]
MKEKEIDNIEKDSKGLSALMRLIRPKQWIKNGFIFMPLFFGGELFNTGALLAGVIAFFAYSFAASSIYCFNDIYDVEADRRHPVKCHRPIASGAVSVKQAYGLMILMLALSIGCSSLLDGWETMDIILFYWCLNLGYCAKFKQYAIIDVCIVAFGFVLRLLAGGVATGVVLSKWIVLMTFLITLFMSFAKRRDDVIRMEKTGEAPRKNTSRYNLTFINQAITITASVTLVCYIMYTVSPEVLEHFHTDKLYLTTVFVLVGLLRYIQIAVVDQQSGDPTKILLRDRITQVIVVAWLAAFLFLIYIA